MSSFTFIDLFAGIGGFRLGLEANNGECLGFSEIDPNAIETYCKNFKENAKLNFGDITKIKKLPKHDIMTAGVPCQSWSIAGKNLGFDDDRGQLWNDTIYLLNQSKPKAFIFENVKGLVDPRNKAAFEHIMERISMAGYYSKSFLLNSYDYGVPQNRQRVYIVGFKEKKYLNEFVLPQPISHNKKLFDFLNDLPKATFTKDKIESSTLFGKSFPGARTKFQKIDELNDFFLFNDIRNGHSTIHSWDLFNTTEREKEICLLLLNNRRKSIYGSFDGNPLSLSHFQALDKSIKKSELLELVRKKILKTVEYTYKVNGVKHAILSKPELLVLKHADADQIIKTEELKSSRQLKVAGINYSKTLDELKLKNCIHPHEVRFDFKNSKISSGINGINRIYLPNSDVFSTLVASDTNDFIATINIIAKNPESFKSLFLKEIIAKKNFRKISKNEALIIQGYPPNFILPENRPKWMKLIGNSVSVPVIKHLCEAIIATGVIKNE